MFIHAFYTIMISFDIEQLLKIHHIILSKRNYIFKLIKTINFSIYAYIIDIETNFVLIRNDIASSIKVSRNFRLNTINEINYINVYVIDAKTSDLIIKTSRSNHKNA